MPKCVKKECFEFQTVLNGRVTCPSGNEIGDECYVECNSGFTGKGNIRPRCQNNKEWENNFECVELPKCHKQTLDLTNMYAACTDGLRQGKFLHVNMSLYATVCLRLKL